MCILEQQITFCIKSINQNFLKKISKGTTRSDEKFFPEFQLILAYQVPKVPAIFYLFLRTLLQPFAQKIRLVILSHLLFWSKILTVNCAFVAFLTSKKAHQFLWQKKYYLQGNTNVMTIAKNFQQHTHTKFMTI